MGKNSNKDYTYPLTDDEEFQSKIFKKREFYYHKIPAREKLEKYEDIKQYRDDICKGDFKLREQQTLLTNFLSPDTPYTGLLIMHGTGTGKTCTAISIAEQFKEQIKKYNTKIYILTFGPNNRETFKSELLFCTGETYLKNKDTLEQMTKTDRELENKIATYGALQYYKILSYKTFYKKVLGEKISEKKIVGDTKIKTSYRKTEEGDYEREIVVDKITNMDNTLLIVDEAHNLTGNEYGEALKKIIRNSKNLRVILLTATPMKNLADDIIDLINFIRPQNESIKRDKIFTQEKNYMMRFKPGGEEYLKKMATGFISFFRGSMPYTFAKRVDKGDIPNNLLFTPLVRCLMEPFQLRTYQHTKANYDDTLDRASSAAANFVYPTINPDGKQLVGTYSTEGLVKFISQLNTNKKELITLINKHIFRGKIAKDDLDNFIVESENKNIAGRILNLKYLRHFSIKFYKCIQRLQKLVEGNKGPGTAFIYSNLVKAGGIELFASALEENGYLEYQENSGDYNIQDNTIDSRTGKTFSQFKKDKLNMSDFNPSTYIIITGGSDDSGEDIPEIKQKIIREVFNNAENKEGKILKLVLGSKVMTEGVTLENTREVHILDVHYNLGKVDQVIGRAIRMCKHQAVITDEYRFPKVNVYRYVVHLNKELSTDEILYQKGEQKYILVKKVEKALKEVAVDCPILLHGNKFPEEIEKYRGCVEPTLENKKKGKQLCPAICNFQECDFKCDDKKLDKLYNTKKGTYKNLESNEIDYTTFNDSLAKSEIINVKSKVKDLYRFKHVYTLKELYNIVKKSYKSYQRDLFDDYFLDKALHDMIPTTENDYNNFKDTIYDKYNRTGYLIQRGNYYIFQPFDDTEDIPMYNRQNYEFETENMIPLKNYFIQKYGDTKDKTIKEVDVKKTKSKSYDFESTNEYYDIRTDNFIVGIIDKNTNKLASETDDLFKIRPPLKKSTDKKRGTGIYSLKGAVCSTSKDKEYLLKVLEKLFKMTKDTSKLPTKASRETICEQIKNILMYLEKYSTSKDNNKLTYVMIPADHPIYEFPYNLEDRVKARIKQVKKLVKRDFDSVVKKMNDGEFMGKKNMKSYFIEIKKDKYISQYHTELERMGFRFDNNKYIMIID